MSTVASGHRFLRRMLRVLGDVPTLALLASWLPWMLPTLSESTTRIDLSHQAPDITIYGADPEDYLVDNFGHSSTMTGDFNADGIADLVLGAPFGDGPSNSRTCSGEVHVFFGPFAGGATVDLVADRADVCIYGVDVNDELGVAVASGDMNGDGFDDLIASAPYAEGPAGACPHCGNAYVLFGPFSRGAVIDLGGIPADVTVFGGVATGVGFGLSVAAGDVTGDGKKDLIIGIPDSDGPSGSRFRCGEVFVLFGPFFSGQLVELPAGADVVIYGDEEAAPTLGGDALGFALAVGDVTQDGIEDLVLPGISAAGPGNSRPFSGQVDVIFGPLSKRSWDFAFEASDYRVYGGSDYDNLGISVLAADVTGDGIRDLLISSRWSPRLSCPFGAVYVFSGPLSSGVVLDMAVDAADVTVYGAGCHSPLGDATAVGDISGDGSNDLILGGWEGRGPAGDRANAGEVAIFYGPLGGATVVDLAVSEPDMIIYGADEGDRLSSIVGTADVSDDGVGDLLLGAAFADGPSNNRPECGEAYVFLGESFPPVARSGGPYRAPCTDAPLDVQVDGSASFDPKGHPILFRWETDCRDASLSDPTLPRAVLTLHSPSCRLTCVVSLTVTDYRGAWDRSEAAVEVVDQTPPDFQGLNEVLEASCQTSPAAVLYWPEASDACCHPSSYSVYRDLTPSFVPSLSNLLIAGLTSTAYEDKAVQCGRTYYYLVRAVDSAAPPNEDTNLVRLPAVMTCDDPPAPPDIGNRLRVTREAGKPRLAYEGYPAAPPVTHYHVRRSSSKSAVPAAPFAQPTELFWTDPASTDPLDYYDVRAAIDCEEIESRN